MDPAVYLPVIESESQRLRDQALSKRAAPIPHCDGWDTDALLVHMGNVYRFVTGIVDAVPQSRDDVPAFSNEEPSADELAGWFDAACDGVVESLRRAGTRTPMWTWSEAGDSGFFHRRMAHETTMHRLDTDMAVNGELGDVDAPFASDGIDEFVHVGMRFSMRKPDRTYPEGSLHLHCTDTDGEWMIRPDGSGGVTITREHAKGDVAVRGPALNILRYVWGRERRNVDVFGDEDLADAWGRCSP